MSASRKKKVTALLVTLDEECDGSGTHALASVMERLRGVRHVKPFLDYDLETPIGALHFSKRPENALLNARITTLRELAARSHQELTRVKNLGKKGLGEIEERLRLLGLSLRPQAPAEDSAESQEDVAVVKDLEKALTVFNETRLALRRLWRAVEVKGYRTQDWQDWRAVDAALRRYARMTAVQAGIDPYEIDKYIATADTEPFLQGENAP